MVACQKGHAELGPLSAKMNTRCCASCAVSAALECVVGLSMYCVADMPRELLPSDTQMDTR